MFTSFPEPPSLVRQRPFVLFWLARLASTMGYQMLAVTIGWQVYELTNSAFDLGLVGLIQFVPAVVLTLLIGHAADHYDRRLIVRTAQGVHALAALMITVALLAGALTRDLLFGAVFLIACARAFELPTAHSLVPALSTWFPLTLLTLAALGASDAVSVVIRFSLVQIETPDDKRGRVSAINYLFVGSSNTLGEFRAGVNAASFGAVASALIGGIGSLLIAGIWMLLFPDLRRIDRFEPADKRLTET
ncbi:MAG: MFS transporter, partial [Pseudolabrys sp.]|jgi:MFS family permease